MSDRSERLEAALVIIRLTGWGWEGGGSEVRIPIRASTIASMALGLPDTLPLGWPSDEEYAEIKAARERLQSPE